MATIKPWKERQPKMPGGPRIPDMIKKPEEPEEVEEVFPWEKGLKRF